jgi:hypothetical protein
MSKTNLVSAKLDRQFELFRELVERTATQPPPPTSEWLEEGGRILVDLWNEGAGRIEAAGCLFPVRLEHRGALEIAFKNPDPWMFPFTRALATLLVLIEQTGDQAFKIMRNVLLSIEIPQSDIDYHATVGLWRTKWRKDKIGQAAQAAASEAWQERENAENLEVATSKTLRNTVVRAHRMLEQIIRDDRQSFPDDPDLRNLSVGRWVVHDSMQSGMGTIVDYYGSDKDNEPMTEAKLRAEELREVFEGLARMTCRAAAEELNRRGIKTATGGRWYPSQVSRTRARLRNK